MAPFQTKKKKTKKKKYRLDFRFGLGERGGKRGDGAGARAGRPLCWWACPVATLLLPFCSFFLLKLRLNFIKRFKIKYKKGVN